MILQLLPRPIPAAIPDGIELVVIGDIHGRSSALYRCLDDIARTPTRLGCRRTLVFLGDLIDRGPDSLGVVRIALEARHRVDNLYILPGNHELMLLDVLSGSQTSLWQMNGGITVLDEVDPNWRSLSWPDAVAALRSRLPTGFEQLLREAPSHLRIGDLLCVHAGLHPHLPPEKHLARDASHTTPTHWATIREPALTWRGGWNWNGSRYEWGNRMVIHGHTPAISRTLLDDPAPLQDCDRIDDHRRLCLDVGATARDQVAWAHIWRKGGTTMLQIHAASGAPLQYGYL